MAFSRASKAATATTAAASPGGGSEASHGSTSTGSARGTPGPDDHDSSNNSNNDNNTDNNTDNENGRILSAKYLQRNKGKKDLIQRLRKVVEVLRDDESIEPDSNEFPGLAALCQELIPHMEHRDKQVRLYTVSACMELFTIYAPDAPWNTDETLEIFRQTIRQLANLAHTTSPTNPHYHDYARILDLLAEVKIGVILVELTKEEECREEALPILAELFRTLLQSVRAEHPSQIAEMTQATICGCFEEFHDGIMLPIPLLDEILVCIGQGPRVLVVNPQKAAAAAQSKTKAHNNNNISKQQLPAHQVEQANPSYLVASSVIRSTVDRLSTPIAALLNGLLNNDPRLVSESSISTQLVKELSKPQTQDQNAHADVYNIIYELHRVAPSILTTVVGTLTNFLAVPEVDQRKLIVQLLGRLFVKAPSKFANKFRLCYREWLERAMDKDLSIRLNMVEDLLLLILPAAKSSVAEDALDQVSQDAQAMLKRCCLDDPASEVRLRTIHGLCDTAYHHPTAVSLDTWLAVGQKVMCKQKLERKHALTGLVQNYYHHYMAQRLKGVQAGGDDVPLEVVQETLEVADNDNHDDRRLRLEWIPSRVFECASWKDDVDLQSRVWQAMDDMLLGSELAAASSSPSSSSSSKKLTSTARAVGLALLVDSLEENASSWLGGLLRERAKLQQKLGEYMDARTKIREYPVGSEEHLTANAHALDLLEAVASFTDVPAGNVGERNPILERFHTAKDKHIFRILSTVATPTHSTKARIRAMDELPKRVKTQGDGVVKFVKGLVRKCAMGDFLNQEIVHHGILLAQECGVQGDWESCRKFLKCIQLAADYFPELCGNQQCFQNLAELFSECRGSTKQPKGIEDVVTTLSAVLAKAASTQPQLMEDKNAVDSSSLRSEMLRLCQDGTPEQARHSVKTLTAMIASKEQSDDDGDGDSEKSLHLLLDALTRPSLLSASPENKRLVSILVALSEFAEAAPQAMSSERGQKAVRFALESVLLGRGQSSGDNDASDEDNNADDDDDDEQDKNLRSKSAATTTTPARRRSSSSSKKKHLSPGLSTDILEDLDLSYACRKLCAGMEFLVSYTRATIFASRNQNIPPGSGNASSISSMLEMVDKLFDTMCAILRDQGMPPSSHDRKDCNLRQDRAALRQCAAIHLLRLCDARLSLDQRFLTPARWHILAGSFLDDERIVRDRIMEELGLMLTGHGKYGNFPRAGQAMTPRFNFLALVVLCTDGDHLGSNGNAANVGKRSNTTKQNAMQCVVALRKRYEVESEQARANGPAAEQQFEMGMKLRLMPEYVLPYAFHLLSFRRETPLGTVQRSTKLGGADSDDDDSDHEEEEDEYTESRESQERVLRKRLKWLFDPLVHSLGETADNISFLMRMSDKLARFSPVGLSLSSATDNARARLQAVCDSSRAVLMSYVKKDVNLATFPGQILVPGNLFRKAPAGVINVSKPVSPATRTANSRRRAVEEQPSDHDTSKSDAGPATQLLGSPASGNVSIPTESPLRNNNDYVEIGHEKKRPSRSSRRSPRHSDAVENRVHFSPDVATREIPVSVDFGALSPIERKLSIGGARDAVLLDSGEKTRGTTPPTPLRDMDPFTASTSIGLSAEVTEESPSSRNSGGRSLRSRSSSRLEAQKAEKSASVQSHSQESIEVPTVETNRKRELVLGDQKTRKKTRKASVPAQIKIVRHRPLKEAEAPKRFTRKRTKADNGEELDFEKDSPADSKAGSKPSRAGTDKENSVQPRMQSRARRSRI